MSSSLKDSKPLEETIHLFWILQLQWNGYETGTQYSVSDVNEFLRLRKNNPKYSNGFRRQMNAFQWEVISPKEVKQNADIRNVTSLIRQIPT